MGAYHTMVRSYTSSGPMYLDENKVEERKRLLRDRGRHNEVLSYALLSDSSDAEPGSDHRAANRSLVYSPATQRVPPDINAWQ